MRFNKYANDFSDIQLVLEYDNHLRQSIKGLILNQIMTGNVFVSKADEDQIRIDKFRAILCLYFSCTIDFYQAKIETEIKLNRKDSCYENDNRTFCTNWSSRLLRTQISRFYNEAILNQLIADGEQFCYIAHSKMKVKNESSKFPLCACLVDKMLDPIELLDNLVDAYGGNCNYKAEPKIPSHPHCTHTIQPVPEVFNLT